MFLCLTQIYELINQKGISSWLHGLNTSLGQSFFENVAHVLSNGEKKECSVRKKNSLKIEQTQKDAITKIITDLTNDNQKPSLKDENAIIFQPALRSNLVEGTDFTADVFCEYSNRIICVELKTVKPNKGVFKVEKQKILEAKAALKIKYPEREIKYFLAFPFDPLSDTPCGYDKKRFMDYSIGFTKFFDEEEVLLGAELWDMLSGSPQTMEEILSIINAIATPNFMNELLFLSNNDNRENDKQNYLKLLEKWSLLQEYELISKYEQNRIKFIKGKQDNTYNKSCFKDGEYQSERVKDLLAFINKKTDLRIVQN